MTISTQLIDFSKVIGGGSTRPAFKTAAVSLAAMLVALSAARAGQDTTISGDTAYDTIYGNHGDTLNTVDETASGSGNKLTFNGNAATTSTNHVTIYGSYVDEMTVDHAANSNTINISAFENNGRLNIIGGYAAAGDAKENQVNITAGTFNEGQQIRGGYTEISIPGETITAADNAVTITGGTFNGDFEISGGYSESGSYSDTLNVTGNAVTVSGVSIPMEENGVTSLYGGYAKIDGDGSTAAVTGNTVTVTSGTFAEADYSALEIVGGKAVNAGSATGATVTGNKVYIKGGTFAGYTTIAGGFNNVAGEVSGNEVHLSGGTFTGDDVNNYVVGGISNVPGAVKNNTVYVSGNVDLGNVDVVAAMDDINGDVIQSGGGNTLVFGEKGKPWNGTRNMVGSVYGFDTVKITAATWGKPIYVDAFSTIFSKNSKTEIDATKVAFAGVDSVKKGDKTELLKTGGFEGELTLKSAASTYTIGTTLQGTGTVSIDTSEDLPVVNYEIDSAEPGPGPKPTPTPGSKVQLQTHTAAMAAAAKMTALNQGADTAQSALSNLSGSGKTGLQGFAAVGGGTARQETGSHVTLNAVNLTAGMGGTLAAGSAKLTVGGALETGHGSFKNHFYAGDAEPYVSKKGDVNYYGGAVLSEMKWANDWHMNANLRAGYAKTEQTGALYNAGTNTVYDIDSGAYYVGTEIGGGKTLRLNEKNSVDLYGKYIYLHQGGDSFYAGGYYDVKGVDSHRLKAGARYDYGFNKTWGVYAGLAGEYEFDGKAKVLADGAAVPPAETKGMSGIGELGVKLTPENSGFSMDVNVKGSVGKYRSALFGIDVKYEF